jgi:hypothetical protein
LVAELARVPVTLGSWEGKTFYVSSDPIMPDATNFAFRRYVNRADGTLVNIMLTRGAPGPLVIKHLPIECYPANGYALLDEPQRFTSEGPDKVVDEFWVATFKKTTDVVPATVRVYWSWTGTGQWQTPAQPRIAFARQPILYKLYVVRPLPNENAETEASPAHDFIKELTAAMRRSFFVAP